MEVETQQFLQERAERIRLIHDRQERELEQFDEESARLGFRCVNLIERGSFRRDEYLTKNFSHVANTQ
jgi:thousand and one amino acid protein kinase